MRGKIERKREREYIYVCVIDNLNSEPAKIKFDITYLIRATTYMATTVFYKPQRLKVGSSRFGFVIQA